MLLTNPRALAMMVARELKDRRAIIVAAGPSLLPETSDVFTASVQLLLEHGPDITAIFAYNDRVALGAL